MPPWAIEQGIEVSGEPVGAILDAFQLFPSLPMKHLLQYGFAKASADGKRPVVDRAGWYPIGDLLAFFKTVAEAMGTNALFRIGQHVPTNALFPPPESDIEKELASIDVAYHMNHRKQGVVMYSPGSGRMLEGIGHYHLRRPGARRLAVLGENPYPCDFDLGIVTAMARRSEPRARVWHEDPQICRKQGADCCTYLIEW